jgi:CRP-like cAMP-binding protein
MPATRELLERVPFLAALERPDLEQLAGVVTRRQFRKGDAIFHKEDEGQSLFIVEDGAVRIYVPSAQGADLTLAILGAGDFFGDLSLLDGQPRSAGADAMQDTRALILERSDFLELMRSRPDAALAIMAVVSKRLRETDEMASDLAFLDVGGRLAKRLLELASSHGVRRDDGTLLDVSITQEQLANMIGVTRESVNRNLASFRRAGLISSQGRRIILRDPDGLRDLCE